MFARAPWSIAGASLPWLTAMPGTTTRSVSPVNMATIVLGTLSRTPSTPTAGYDQDSSIDLYLSRSPVTFLLGEVLNCICVHDFVTTLIFRLMSGGITVYIQYVLGENHDERQQKFLFKMMEVPDELATLQDQLNATSRFTTAEQVSPDSTKAAVEAESNASPTSMQLAAHWLQYCVENHASCNLPASFTPWCPTRLLDLGESDIPDKHIGLINTQDHAPLGLYATLSHYCGQKLFIKLTKSTVSQFCQKISTKAMSRTFQDAVIVCRELQIRYLWIDSLYMIQDEDDLTNWSHEVRLMNKVCNISASDAQDSTYDLFRSRTKSSVDPMFIKTALEVPNQDTRTREYYAEEPFYWLANVADSHISKRGWVLQ